MSTFMLERPDRDPNMPTRVERIGYVLGDMISLAADVLTHGVDRVNTAIDAAQDRRDRNTQLMARFAELSAGEQAARLALDTPDLDLLERTETHDAEADVDAVIRSIFDASSLAIPVRDHHETGRTLLGLAVRQPRA